MDCVRDVEREDGGQVFFFRGHKQNLWAGRCALRTVCISSTMRRGVLGRDPALRSGVSDALIGTHGDLARRRLARK